MRKLLKLQHYKHTGKLLHHRHTSYRALAVLLALTGGVIVKVEWSMHQIANADSLFVTATVPAPIPTTAAAILHPTEGQGFSDPIITVNGSCEVLTPATTVAIYSNDTHLLGSTPCDPDGTFSLQVTLLAGINKLVARSLTITGDYSPDSTPVNVTYTPPTPPSPPPSGGGTSGKPPSGNGNGGGTSRACAAVPLAIELTITKPFLVFGPGVPVEWVGTINGGCVPYTVTIDWGDKTSNTYQNIGNGEQHFSHPYKVMKPHHLLFTVTDDAGNKAVATYSAVTPYLTPSIGNILQGKPGGLSPYTMFAIYSAYLSALCIAGVFWIRAHRYNFAHATVSNRRIARHKSVRTTATRRRK